MSRKPLKVSGLIQSGRLVPQAGITASTAFDTPAEAPAAEIRQDQPTESALTVRPTIAPAIVVPVDALGIEKLIDLDLLDDSPFQTRLKYDPVRIDEISQSFLSAGQSTPITARQMPNGRYEIIKGQTRKKAAINIGWKQARVLIVSRTDREAELDVMVDNTGAPPTEYEEALMFRKAMSKEYATTQKAVAAMFLCSQAKVSNGLAMLNLPAEVLSLLDEEPGLFGAHAAKVINSLWESYPTHHHVILKAIQRLKEGADQGSIQVWVTQQINAATRPPRAQKHLIPSSSGAPRYLTQAKDRDIIVRISDRSIDAAMVHQRIDEMLRKMADEVTE